MIKGMSSKSILVIQTWKSNVMTLIDEKILEHVIIATIPDRDGKLDIGHVNGDGVKKSYQHKGDDDA